MMTELRNEIKKSKLVFDPRVARTLCKKSFPIIDIKPLRGEPDKTVFVFENTEDFMDYFSENDIYISVRVLQTLSGSLSTGTLFTQNLKKIYNLKSLENLGSNIPHVKCNFQNGKLKILKGG